MISIIKNGAQGIKLFACDKADELKKINLRATSMGSRCFVIENSKQYILNGSGEWKEIKNSASSSGSSEGQQQEPVEENSYVWDGGNSAASDEPAEEDFYVWDGGNVA